ncbi:hypothetical protein GJAV_G00082320 [Gymnothorax javanicus]|nr:hypothetical protein GJAV_G00082320 [Gymnothorax javanicus]
MSKKKSKKKKKRREDGNRSTSSSPKRHDKSSKEKDYSKEEETAKRKHSSSRHVRPMKDEERRSRRVDSFPSPGEHLTQCLSKKDRPYKKPVYRLGTVSQAEKGRVSHEDVREKQSTSRSASISEDSSEKRHGTEKSSLKNATVGESAQKHLSEELREQRRLLVKQQSKRALGPDSCVHSSQGKGIQELSQEPKSTAPPSTYSKTVNLSAAISKDLYRCSKSSDPSRKGQEEKPYLKPDKPLSFKIPKKARVVLNKDEIWEGCTAGGDTRTAAEEVPGHSKTKTLFSSCRYSDSISILEKDRPSHETNSVASHFARASSLPSEICKKAQVTDNKRITASNSSILPVKNQSSRVPSKSTETYDGDLEMQLIAELHQARSQKLLEVSVVDSYGELTSMDIDPPEEVSSFSISKGHIHQDLLIVLDTNILLSHLDFVKKMRSQGLGAVGFPVILIPWVVMQELDSLKDGRLSSHVEHKARPAVHYIYTTLKSQEPRLWGQSMQQASQRICGLDAENNDDRVLHCCLQYQGLYPGAALILCTNDKNLCSKALLSGVKALSKDDLLCEVERLQSGPQVLTVQPLPIHWPPHTAEDKRQSQSQEGNDENGGNTAAEAREVSTSVSVLEEALRGALSLILESEMKAAFDDLWLEVVLLKPPWSLGDLLLCFKKHWIAVFGQVVERSLLSSIECLSDCLCKGKTVDRHSTVLAAREARQLLLAFSCRSGYSEKLAKPLAVVEQLLQDVSQSSRDTGQTAGRCMQASNDGDVLMAVEETVTESRPSCQEVWAVFDNIWNNVCQVSSAVFTALRFVPGTLETTVPSDGSSPPEEALSCLHKLIFTIRQLLELLQRVLSLERSAGAAQALLAFISSSEVATIQPSFTAEALEECLSQQEYREKLSVGGSQLMELSLNLERCALAVGHRAGTSSCS